MPYRSSFLPKSACHLFALAGVVSSLFFGPQVSAAEDSLSTAPFALRFPAAFAHFSPFADVAAKGGAATASPFGSSPSLAGIAWGFQPDAFDYQLSANYDYLSFDAGTVIHINTQTMAMDAGDVGIFRLTLVEFQSNNSLTQLAPLSYELDLLGSRLDWSKRFGDYGVGAGIGFTRSETLFSTPLLKVSDADKDNWTYRIGGQRQLGKRWLVAMMLDYGSGHTDVVKEAAPGLLRSSEQSMDQWIAQTGLAFMITPKAVAHLDYQCAWFGDGTEELTTHRWSVGSDLPVTSWLMLRAGASTDQHGNVGWSGGFAVLPRAGTSINLAYQNGMFPELDREFGQSQMFNLSLSFKW